MNSKAIDLEGVTKRLDVVIDLLFKIAEKEGKSFSIKDRIIMLHSFGLTPAEIAGITGKSNIHVNKELSLYRKESKSHPRGSGEDG